MRLTNGAPPILRGVRIAKNQNGRSQFVSQFFDQGGTTPVMRAYAISWPMCSLALVLSEGKLYGTTLFGGADGNGVVYEVTP
jgi:uncharacterized repeat protein (TIGR03803 family)